MTEEDIDAILNRVDKLKEDGRRYVKHYLIDFTSTLGASADVLNPRLGYEFGFDVAAIGRRTFTLGQSEDDWRKREGPDFQGRGYFDSTYFDPGAFAPLQPNSAFANTTKPDAYWAAKIPAAFRDEHIDAILAEGGYREPGGGAEVLSRADLDHPFLVMEFQLNRGKGWSRSVMAYLAPASGRIIAVSR
jgi:hypothetical protein